MKYRCFAAVLPVILGAWASPPARGADVAAFERAFEDATLRVDYHHGGNSVTEFAVWDRSIRQPGIWAGSRVHRVDSGRVGRTLVEVKDAASGEVLFAKRSDSYYAEYRTTALAATGAERIYHESALIPFPKRKVQFSVSVRQPDRSHKTLMTLEIDPSNPASIATEPLRGGVTVVEAHRSGDPHEKVDVAILGEGYTRADEAKFRADLARFTATLFGQEPFKAARDRFNVRGVWLPSQEPGADEPARGVWRDTVLGTRFDSLGSERYLLTEDNRALRELAAHVPYDTLFVMVNTPRYGGGGIYNLFCTFTTDNQWSPYVFLHEFGHSFAALADEYYSSDVAYTDFFPRGVEPIEPNITALLDPKALKWADLATPGLPLPTPWPKAEFDAAEVAYQQRRRELNDAITAATRSGSPAAEVARLQADAEAASKSHVASVDARIKHSPLASQVGAFEGAGYTSKGLYRPALDCIMFSRGDKPFCPVCHRAIEQTIARLGEGDLMVSDAAGVVWWSLWSQGRIDVSRFAGQALRLQVYEGGRPSFERTFGADSPEARALDRWFAAHAAGWRVDWNSYAPGRRLVGDRFDINFYPGKVILNYQTGKSPDRWAQVSRAIEPGDVPDVIGRPAGGSAK